jgi:hypothetical protein
VLEALRGVAEQPVDVRPHHVRPGEQLGGVVIGRPAVHGPDPAGGAGQVAGAHHHGDVAQPGPVHEQVVTQFGGLLLEPGGGVEGVQGVPEQVVLDRQEGSRELLRVPRVLRHLATSPHHRV